MGTRGKEETRRLNSRATSAARTRLSREFPAEYRQHYERARTLSTRYNIASSRAKTVLVQEHHDRYMELAREAKAELLFEALFGQEGEP